MKALKKERAMQMLTALLVFITFAITGCDNSTEVQSNGVSASFFSEGKLNKIQNNSLTLNEVKLLIRNLKLDRVEDNGSSDVKLGPFVILLNSDGFKTGVQVNDIPPGSYKRVKFEVHKLEDHEIPPDPEFKEGESGSERFSAIIKGEFNSVSFIYKSQRTTYQEIEFPTPLIVDDNISVNFTIKVNPYSWFFENGEYLDPSDEANRSEIEMNIEHSFKEAYKDNNKDGFPD
jgi:hypothetical protein